MEATNKTHDRCLYSEIDCQPKAIIDFDTFYSEHPTTEFFKISNVLDASSNVEVVAAAARVCVLDAVFDRKDLHQGNRDGTGPQTPQYRYENVMLEKMLNQTTELRDKYATDPWDTEVIAQSLVTILNNYIVQIQAEYLYELSFIG